MKRKDSIYGCNCQPVHNAHSSITTMIQPGGGTLAANELERMAKSHFRCELACFVLSLAAIHISNLSLVCFNSDSVSVFLSD
ncbi:hypothetical protein PHET_03883 [Paragonimus heterotremus]|uniref:Uncharacterized protein n=1 Tax=Paragonimus heterotremus TaxID=100268 RepID=A0A8J4WS50_9TREM|nr:hypothetical protein PHET_03883 [Paragonimus heterotremus]